jgi:hypothetical protein
MKKIIIFLAIFISSISVSFSMNSSNLDYIVIDNSNLDFDLLITVNGYASNADVVSKYSASTLVKSWIMNACNYQSICRLLINYTKDHKSHLIANIYVNTKKSPIEVVEYDNDIDEDYEVYFGPTWNTFYVVRRNK